MLVTLPVMAQQRVGDTESYFPQRLTAQELAAACASSKLTAKGRERRQYCAGFISGVEEALRIGASREGGPASGAVCVPENVTASRLADTYVRYVSTPDTSLGRPAVVVAMEALKSAFPCR
jgi:hypothetical protein